jgi:hypothetical protein
LLPIETIRSTLLPGRGLDYVIDRIRQALHLSPYQEALPLKLNKEIDMRITKAASSICSGLRHKQTRKPNDIVAVFLTGSVLTPEP